MIMRTLLTSILISFSAVAFSQSEAEQEVKRCMETLMAADNAGDLAGVLSSYHMHAELWPPNATPIVGRQAIEKNYRDLFAREKLVLRSSLAEVFASGKHATVTGYNSGEHRYKDGKVRPIDDKFVAILMKEGDKWKITKLIWNSSR